MNIQPLTRAFKCSIFRNDNIRKVKAIFCAQGDYEIEDVDYFDTFAPVSNKSTTEIMLVLTILLNFQNKWIIQWHRYTHQSINLLTNPKLTELEIKQIGV